RRLAEPSLGECYLVPRRGLEPPRLSALVPETSASTNSAIWALRGFINEPVHQVNSTLAPPRFGFAKAEPPVKRPSCHYWWTPKRDGCPFRYIDYAHWRLGLPWPAHRAGARQARLSHQGRLPPARSRRPRPAARLS